MIYPTKAPTSRPLHPWEHFADPALR